MKNENLGPLMVDVPGLELTKEDCEILEHPSVGGVIIFARNYHDVKQITHLNNQIKNLKSKNKQNGNQLLISIDQEGGPVQRIKDPLTVLPSMSELGRYYEYDHSSAINLAKQLGWLLASELITLGFDFSFTPVVDLNLCDNKIIKLRSFHKKSDVVTELSLALKYGLNHAGMSAVAKHFPGHGGVTDDSHLTTPTDNRDFNEIDKHDLVPYKALINDNVEGIMTSHIIFPNIDNNIVSFSKFWLQDILREKLNFNGLIISDDLDMKGANFIIGTNSEEKINLDYSDRVSHSLNAGCDLILVCNNRESVVEILNNWQKISWKHSELYSNKLETMRAKGVLAQSGVSSISKLQQDKNWLDASINIDKLKSVV